LINTLIQGNKIHNDEMRVIDDTILFDQTFGKI